MYFAEITTDPQPHGHNYVGIGARRKNGDRIRIFGETKRQVKAIRKLLMKLGQHFGLPMANHADFVGIERINAANDDLIDCLSSVPDPYAPDIDMQAAWIAWRRDWKICNRILAQDPSIDQLLSVSGNQQDWMTWFRCNHPDARVRDALARDIAKVQPLISENRERLAKQRKANGQPQTN
jgi:hypothetical protein